MACMYEQSYNNYNDKNFISFKSCIYFVFGQKFCHTELFVGSNHMHSYKFFDQTLLTMTAALQT